MAFVVLHHFPFHYTKDPIISRTLPRPTFNVLTFPYNTDEAILTTCRNAAMVIELTPGRSDSCIEVLTLVLASSRPSEFCGLCSVADVLTATDTSNVIYLSDVPTC